jgi:hypothetical protein
MYTGSTALSNLFEIEWIRVPTFIEAPAPKGKQLGERESRRQRHIAVTAACGSAIGCTPTVDAFGTYFPPSLVSAAIGLLVSYALVRIIARSRKFRPLTHSALFFASLIVIAGSLAWWGLFGDF